MPRLPSPAPALVLIALAAWAAPASAQTVAPPPVAPPPVPAPPSHPAELTGWAQVLTAGEALRTAPDPAAPVAGAIASTGIGGRVQRVATGADGQAWVRVAFPDRIQGWAPGTALAAAPAPAALAPAVRRALTRRAASLGRRASLVVRDPFGRTLFAAGAREPLILASVTKLATVTAALGAIPLPERAAAAILGPSDNARAQTLSTRIGGGSSALGARRASDHLATLGARWTLTDGSGLSRGNQASAGEVADLLLAVRDSERFRVLFRGMPVAARSGTLRYRMEGTTAAGRVRAKTGSLFDAPAASALAGYVWPSGSGLGPERALVMVVLVNRVTPERARAVQDAIAQALTAPGALVEPLR